jgi:hypothetical protein
MMMMLPMETQGGLIGSAARRDPMWPPGNAGSNWEAGNQVRSRTLSALSSMEITMLHLFVVAGLIAASSIILMSGAIAGLAPLMMELAAFVFAVSAGISTMAIAAIDA